MRNSFKLLFLFTSNIIVFLYISISFTHAEDFYKWVDQNGSTHYTKSPPPKNAKNKSKVQTQGWKKTNQTDGAPHQETSAPPLEKENQPQTVNEQAIIPPLSQTIPPKVPVQPEKNTVSTSITPQISAIN